MKKGIFVLSVIFSMLMAGNASATSYTGTLTTPTGLTATSEWANGVSISWQVDDTTNPGYWTYRYTFDDTYGQAKNLSHVIIEVSQDFTISDVFRVTGASSSVLGTFSGADSSNEFMPGPLYGIKFNWEGGDPAVFTLVTPRAPVWGDFYARDGKTSQLLNSVYNADFLTADPAAPPAGGTVGFNILRPDTATQVPEPATLLLLGSGLAGLSLFGRKKFKA